MRCEGSKRLSASPSYTSYTAPLVSHECQSRSRAVTSKRDLCKCLWNGKNAIIRPRTRGRERRTFCSYIRRYGGNASTPMLVQGTRDSAATNFGLLFDKETAGRPCIGVTKSRKAKTISEASVFLRATCSTHSVESLRKTGVMADPKGVLRKHQNDSRLEHCQANCAAKNLTAIL